MNVIIVFPKMEHGRYIRRILQQNGFEVNAVCTTGAQALQHANELSGGIVICGYRFADMLYTELYEYLPQQFEMLLIASAAVCSSRERQKNRKEIVWLKMPLMVHELVRSMHMMSDSFLRKKKCCRGKKERTDEENKLLSEAKALLMERNHMTEEEAHRYLQKRSMDNGTGIVETAQMVLSIMG